MQTFLPYPDFQKCAKVIDNKRLWKQILEANQLIQIIKNKKIKSYWRGKSTYRMWEDDSHALRYYRDCFVKEWLKRRLKIPPKIIIDDMCYMPDWMIKENKQIDKICSSHRAALLKKNFEHYSQFGWKEKPEINYYWPK